LAGLHTSQAAHALDSQHTPSTQWRLAHCESALQAAALRIVQAPLASQTLSAVQLSASAWLNSGVHAPWGAVQAWQAPQCSD
jgi:hypothetical protein